MTSGTNVNSKAKIKNFATTEKQTKSNNLLRISKKWIIVIDMILPQPLAYTDDNNRKRGLLYDMC